MWKIGGKYFSPYAFSLQTKLLAALTVLAIVVIGPVGLYWFQSQQKIASAELEAHATYLANQLSKSLAAPLRNHDLKALRDQIDAAMLDSQVVSTTLLIAESEEEIVTKKSDGAIVDGIKRSVPVIYIRDRPYLRDQPVAVELGMVHMVFTRDYMRQKLLQTRTMIATIIFSLLAFLFAATYFLLKRMVQKPVGELVAMSGRIALGDFETRIPVSSGDEIGILASKFNFMTAKLQEAMEGLRSSEEKYRGIFENSLDGIYQISLEGQMLSANPAMARILGYDSPEELVREVTNIRQQLYVHPEERDGIVSNILETGKALGKEFECRRRDGQTIVLSINARAVTDKTGQTIFIEGIATDVTERKRSEQELKRHRDHLEELVKERTAELLVAKERAEVANTAKGAFLANMSHELRTPLNAILGYAQILKRDKQLNGRQVAGVITIQQSGEHLLTLINDILDLSKIEAGKLELEPRAINFPAFLQLIADIIRVKAEEKSLQFVYRPLPNLPRSLLADEKRLRQVLLNLLGNATKFTDRGQVNLFVERLPDSNSKARLRFEVHDTGIGMTAAQLQAIFRPFEQAGDLNRRSEGAGLGLAISRELVRLMGGDIHVESEPAKGSCFSFELSMEIMADAPELSPQQIVTGYQGFRRKILIVDDVVGNSAMLAAHLSPLGFDIMEAANGEEALIAIEKTRPDLILMDKMMPVMDGMQAIRRIRQLPTMRDTPIIAVSASAGKQDHIECLEAGANGFISKPIELQLLLHQIGEHLKLSWVFDRAPQAPGTIGAESADMSIPPQHEMQSLYELALTGNMRDIRHWADRIVSLDQRYHPFAHKLHHLVQGYQSQAILEMAEKYLRES